MQSDRNLDHLYPAFADKIRIVLRDLALYCKKHAPGYVPFLTEGLRSAEYQNWLYQQGRTRPGKIVTHRDGYRARSNHQSALAADIGFKLAGKYVVEPPEHLWDYYAHLLRREKLTAGADFQSFPDRPHAEWPSRDRATYKLAEAWLKEQDWA